jgi:hypothetical protein
MLDTPKYIKEAENKNGGDKDQNPIKRRKHEN